MNELEYLINRQENIKFLSLDSSVKNVKFSAMGFATTTSGNLAESTIELTFKGVFPLLGTTGSFVSLRIVDKIKDTDTIKLYNSFMQSRFDRDDNDRLLEKINETINIEPDSKKFNIN